MGQAPSWSHRVAFFNPSFTRRTVVRTLFAILAGPRCHNPGAGAGNTQMCSRAALRRSSRSHQQTYIVVRWHLLTAGPVSTVSSATQGSKTRSISKDRVGVDLLRSLSLAKGPRRSTTSLQFGVQDISPKRIGDTAPGHEFV